jgi:two-component system response regulator VicR
MAKRKLLIVEDDAVVAAVYTFQFKEVGFEVDWATDGQQALKKLQEQSPEAVLLDIQIPKLSGLDVLKWIRAQPG